MNDLSIAGFKRRATGMFMRRILVAAVAFAPSLGAASAAVDCRLGLPPEGLAAAPNEIGQPARVSLGATLFGDRRLSSDGTVGCVTCHDPHHAFTDRRPRAKGVGGQTGTRNAPSLINAAYAPVMSWDGRRSDLEDQAVAPFTDPREHGLSDMAEVLRRLRASKTYERSFQQAFPNDQPAISEAHVRIALGDYLRTLTAGGSAFDRFRYGKVRKALDGTEREGFALFTGRAGCSECHRIQDDGALFTDFRFHRIGIGMERISPRLGELTQAAVAMPGPALEARIFADPDLAALGHFLASRKPADIGRFRTPSLRNVALTAPYMHDGSIATLPEAIDAELYYRGLETGKPVALTPPEKRALVSFLRALTGCQPPLPPPGNNRR